MHCCIVQEGYKKTRHTTLRQLLYDGFSALCDAMLRFHRIYRPRAYITYSAALETTVSIPPESGWESRWESCRI